MDKVVLLSNRVWIAENASNGNMQAKFVICDFSTNKNGVRLNRDTIENWMQSMVNQPLVGKIKKSALDGITDFTGHNMKKSIIKNSDGEYENVVEFDTDALGVFTSVAIEEVDDTECIVGTAEIWNRYPRAVNLIRERIESGTLQTSWEITVNSARTENDEKIIDDGVFTALACLGRKVEPAYDSSRLLEVAEAEMDDELTSAIVDDLKENAMEKNKKGTHAEDEAVVDDVMQSESVVEEPVADDVESTADPELTEEIVEPDASAEEVEEKSDAEPAESVDETKENVEENEAEPVVSMLTAWDLSERIWKAIKDKTDNWGYVAYWFPEQNMVWWKPDDAASELDLIAFVYSVLEDDTVVVDDGIPVKLTISIAEMQAELTKKDEAIAGAVAEIAELKSSLSALESFKDAYEKAEAERIEAERHEKRENLKAYALRSGLISAKDCESDEIAQMLDNLDEAGIKQEIASRYMASRDVKPAQKTEGVVTASLTTEETRPAKANAVMAYITR